jgi:hypothetical protein
MARRSKSVTRDVRRPRNRTPRRERVREDPVLSNPNGDDRGWIIRIANRMEAEKILNASKERPYWASIRHGEMDGNPPTTGYFPCSWFRTRSRVYYGFLFRHHMLSFLAENENARPELLDRVLVAKTKPRI